MIFLQPAIELALLITHLFPVPGEHGLQFQTHQKVNGERYRESHQWGSSKIGCHLSRLGQQRPVALCTRVLINSAIPSLNPLHARRRRIGLPTHRKAAKRGSRSRRRRIGLPPARIGLARAAHAVRRFWIAGGHRTTTRLVAAARFGRGRKRGSGRREAPVAVGLGFDSPRRVYPMRW